VPATILFRSTRRTDDEHDDQPAPEAERELAGV
jgi:hypothetical protein